MHVAYVLTCFQFVVGSSTKKIHGGAHAESFFCGMTTSNIVGLDAITCTPLLSYPAINSSEAVCMCVFARLHGCNGCEMTCEDMIVSFLPLLFSFLRATHFVPTHMHTLVVQELGHMPVASVSLWLK